MAASPAKLHTKNEEITFEEYVELPLIRDRYEILEGVMIMSPAPSLYHQWLLSNLSYSLYDHVRSLRLGIVLIAPVDVIIRKQPKLKTRQPDVVYLNTERTGFKGGKSLKTKPGIEVAPDLAVEILSPKEDRTTKAGKLTDYAAIGVLEVWMVSPQAETVEVLKLDEGQYTRVGIYGQGDIIRSTVLPDMTLTVTAIFEEE